MEHPLQKKNSLIMLGLLVAGATASNLRNTGAYSDPYCKTFNADGSCCLKCSYHYFMNAHGRCQAVSDWCKTWDHKTGCCTSCFEGYGAPVNGVCSSIPVGDDCSDEVSYGKQVKRPKSKFGSKKKRSHSKKSMKSRKSPDCSEEKVIESCEESYSGLQKGGKWGKLDKLGYKHNVKFGHKVAEKLSQRKERQSRWFSKKACIDGDCKMEECNQKCKELSCGKKKDCESVDKKSCRSLSKNSHYSKKKDCESVGKKSCRSLSKKSHHSKKKDCESVGKKSLHSRKSKHSEKKSKFEGLSKKKVELCSKHECGSKKCCDTTEHYSVKKVHSLKKRVEGLSMKK